MAPRSDRDVFVVRALDEQSGMHTWVYPSRDRAQAKRRRWQALGWRTQVVRRRIRVH